MTRPLLCVLVTALLCALARPAHAEGVPRLDCFPFERLPTPARELAETMLLEAMDREALFTLIGGLKPMSSALLTEERRFSLDTSAPQIGEIETFQQIAATWRCADEVWAGLAPLPAIINRSGTGLSTDVDELGRLVGVRTVYGNVMLLPAVRTVLTERRSLFAYHGITRLSDPAEMVTRIGLLDSLDRELMFGYLYGYPSHAVEFYSRLLHQARQSGQGVRPGQAVNVNIPTFAPVNGTLSQFRYRVAPGHKEVEDDRRLRARAGWILREYTARRANYVGEGKPGILALLRDWYDDGKGLCAPSNVRIPVE
jgi:hypothetical protein